MLEKFRGGTIFSQIWLQIKKKEEKKRKKEEESLHELKLSWRIPAIQEPYVTQT